MVTPTRRAARIASVSSADGVGQPLQACSHTRSAASSRSCCRFVLMASHSPGAEPAAGTRVAAVTNALLQAPELGLVQNRLVVRGQRTGDLRAGTGYVPQSGQRLVVHRPEPQAERRGDAPYSVHGELVSWSLSVNTTSLYVCASSYGAAVRDMGVQTCSRPGPGRSPPSSSTPPHPRATTPRRPAADDLRRTIPAGPKVCPPSRRHCPSVRCVGKFRLVPRSWMKPSRRGSSVARS